MCQNVSELQILLVHNLYFFQTIFSKPYYAKTLRTRYCLICDIHKLEIYKIDFLHGANVFTKFTSGNKKS